MAPAAHVYKSYVPSVAGEEGPCPELLIESSSSPEPVAAWVVEYALTLAREGASVVVNDLGGARDGTGAGHNMADQVVQEIKDAGGRAVANYDSVAEPEGGENIVKTAIEEFGKIDGIVSNAGILRDGTFHKMRVRELGFRAQGPPYGGYNVIRAAWPHFREQSYGRIVVATSTSGLFGNFGQANYSAAKLGLVGLIKHAGPGRRQVQHQGQCAGAHRRDPHDRGHPAAPSLQEAHPGVRRPGGRLPVHRRGAGPASVFIVGGGKVQRAACSRTRASPSTMSRASTTSPPSGRRSTTCRPPSTLPSSSAERDRVVGRHAGASMIRVHGLSTCSARSSIGVPASSASLNSSGNRKVCNGIGARSPTGWRGGYVPAMNLVRRGELPWTRLDDLHRRILDELLRDATSRRARTTSTTSTAHMASVGSVAGRRGRSVPGYKERFTITTLSNGNVSLLTEMAKHAGLPWDCVLSAEIFGHYKPDREAYLGCAQILDVAPEETMLVAPIPVTCEPPAMPDCAPPTSTGRWNGDNRGAIGCRSNPTNSTSPQRTSWNGEKL